MGIGELKVGEGVNDVPSVDHIFEYGELIWSSTRTDQKVYSLDKRIFHISRIPSKDGWGWHCGYKIREVVSDDRGFSRWDGN